MNSGFFDVVLDSTEDLDDCIALLRGVSRYDGAAPILGDVVARIEAKRPYPLILFASTANTFEE